MFCFSDCILSNFCLFFELKRFDNNPMSGLFGDDEIFVVAIDVLLHGRLIVKFKQYFSGGCTYSIVDYL